LGRRPQSRSDDSIVAAVVAEDGPCFTNGEDDDAPGEMMRVMSSVGSHRL
jgi:hypothetical protein